MSNLKSILDNTKHSVELVAVDYDGTVFESNNSEFNHETAANLLIEILKRGYHLVVISARDASFRKSVVPLIQPLLPRTSAKCYFGGGNGSYLMHLTREKAIPLYNYSLDNDEVDLILDAVDRSSQELNLSLAQYQTKGLNTFNGFLTDIGGWSGLISNRNIKKSKVFDGKLFIENSKISCVLPDNKLLRRSFQNKIGNQLAPKYNLKGDSTFIHISKKIPYRGRTIDNKLYALKTVLIDLNLGKHQVAAFGDSPTGNDQAMLHAVPASFTNNPKFHSRTRAPYYLAGNQSPVEKVHTAIRFLIY